jgi:hypothetical protein
VSATSERLALAIRQGLQLWCQDFPSENASVWTPVQRVDIFCRSVPVQVINRFCASGLMAVTLVANQIKSGSIQVGLAVGVESMTEKWVH